MAEQIELSAMENPISVMVDPKAVAIVEEVVNKRRVGSVMQYECRWTGSGSDDTSWEPAESLVSKEELAAIEHFEKCQSWVITECCGTRVSTDELDARQRCSDRIACARRCALRGATQSRGKRQRKAPSK